LLANCLKQGVPNIETKVYRDGWPKDPAAFDGADAIVIFADGDEHHPLIGHWDQVDQLIKQGVGLACLHYALDAADDKSGENLKSWIGGYFAEGWSVNPFWTAQYETLPDHPITRGVGPFSLHDEWYFHMRFQDDMEGVTPILTAVPPDETRTGPDGPYSGNPTVRARKGLPEHTAWAYQRPDGGRGFGFTGGHLHWNWANDNIRTIVLNAIVWVAGIEVPQHGAPSKTPTLVELEANQDYPQPENFDRAAVIRLLQSWK
jgi:type 1 glutamine amidotransferase